MTVDVMSANNAKNLIIFAHNFNIEVFNGKTQKPEFSITKFSPEITGCAFRRDGIFAAFGDSTGKLRILDVERKVFTREHAKHKSPLHGISFASEGTIIGSASDDRNLIFFDYSINEIVKVFPNFHKDNIRVLRSVPTEPNLFLTGSHDFSMKLVDLREPIVEPCQGDMDLEINTTTQLVVFE